MNNERDQRPTSLTFAEVIQNAKETLLTQGSHIPTLIIEGEQQGLIVEVPDIPSTHGERMRQMLLVGFAVAQSRGLGTLKQVYFVSEAWKSIIEDGKMPELPPSEDPKRQEILVVMRFRAEQRQMEFAIIEMIRDAQGLLRELKDYAPQGRSDMQAESPLLTAFVQGYQQCQDR